MQKKITYLSDHSDLTSFLVQQDIVTAVQKIVGNKGTVAITGEEKTPRKCDRIKFSGFYLNISSKDCRFKLTREQSREIRDILERNWRLSLC